MTVHDRDDFEVVYWEREWLTYYHNTPQIVQASEFGETISSGRWISTSIAKIGLSDAQRGVIGLAWARDGQAYYFGPAAVEGADYPSFEVINAGLAKDKNRTYEGAFAK